MAIHTIGLNESEVQHGLAKRFAWLAKRFAWLAKRLAWA